MRFIINACNVFFVLLNYVLFFVHWVVYSIIRKFKVCKNMTEMIGGKNENVLLYGTQTYIFSVER